MSKLEHYSYLGKKGNFFINEAKRKNYANRIGYWNNIMVILLNLLEFFLNIR